MSENKSKVTLSVDVMSGDQGPVVTIPAAVSVLKKFPDLNICLVGQAAGIQDALHGLETKRLQSRISIRDASDVVSMNDMPGKVLRRGQQTSMWQAVQAVAEGKADACVSAGNTGALMAVSKYQLKTLKGIKRPAICAALPTQQSATHMLDLGADVAASSDQLVQYALMGKALIQTLYEKDNPSIGVLNIGSEQTKGQKIQQEAAQKIKEMSLNYQGFIEGTDLYAGEVDVVVCDGFSGNVALKSGEGMAQYMLKRVQQAFGKNLFTRFIGWILTPILKDSIQALDPRKYNGASLLGLTGLVVKSHGNADVYAFEQALKVAYKEVKRNLIAELESALLNTK